MNAIRVCQAPFAGSRLGLKLRQTELFAFFLCTISKAEFLISNEQESCSFSINHHLAKLFTKGRYIKTGHDVSMAQ